MAASSESTATRRGSEEIIFPKASRRSCAFTMYSGGVMSLFALQTSGGHASASFGLVRRSTVSNAIGPRSADPNSAHTCSGPTIRKAPTKAAITSIVPAAKDFQIFKSNSGDGWESSVGIEPLAIARTQQPRLLALPIPLLDGLALVGLALALGDAELAFGNAAGVEIDRERHNRHALPIDAALQLFHLALAQQKFARPLGRVVVAVGRRIFGDIGVDQKKLAVLLGGEGFGDAGATPAQRFHLAAQQHQSGFQRVLDEIIMPRLAILRDALGLVFGHQALVDQSGGGKGALDLLLACLGNL